MKCPTNELKKKLGPSAFAAWKLLLNKSGKDGVVEFTMEKLRTALSHPKKSKRQVTRIVGKLGEANLFTRSGVSSSGIVGSVYGRTIDDSTVDVPASTVRWMESARGRGRPSGIKTPLVGDTFSDDKYVTRTGGATHLDKTPENHKETTKICRPNNAPPPDVKYVTHLSENVAPPAGKRQPPTGAETRTPVKTGADARTTRIHEKEERSELLTNVRNPDASQREAALRASVDFEADKKRSYKNNAPTPHLGETNIWYTGDDGERMYIDILGRHHRKSDARAMNAILGLPFVPPRRLEDGSEPEVFYVEPYAPKASKDMRPGEILKHVARLWKELRQKFSGKDDFRVYGIAKSSNKSRINILDWWGVCAEHGVKPAEWLYWALYEWERRHGDKQPQLFGIMSASRVRDNAQRHIFKKNRKPLGGRSVMPRDAKIYQAHRAKFEQAISSIYHDFVSFLSEDQIKRVVSEFYPRGVDNAALIMRDIDMRCRSENESMSRAAASGGFVWKI